MPPPLLQIADVIHMAATFAMAGIIWFVQVIHYPGLDRPGMTGSDYETNASRTGYVIAPLMVTEATASLILLVVSPNFLHAALFALVAALWLWTFLVSLPRHSHLIRQGHDRATVRSLVRTNWPRTILWSGRAALLATASLSA